MDLNKIVEAFSKEEPIEEVLTVCPKVVKLEFLLKVCKSVEHLMPEASKAVIPELERCIDTGQEFDRKIYTRASDAAYAAYASSDAAHYAANASYAASCAAYAADYASNAAFYTTYALTNNEEVRKEQMRSYILMLKEIVLSHVPVAM